MHQPELPTRTPGLRLAGITLLLCLLPLATCQEAFAPDAREPLNVPHIAAVDDSSLPESLRHLYREDAARLALRYINERGGAWSEEVELPDGLVGTLYNALVHVYRTGYAARDSVVEIYKVHTFPMPTTHRLLVAVDSTEAWVEAWRRGSTLTGKTAVDDLIERYDLELREYYDWSFGHAARLRSTEPLNIAALAPLFDGIDGVRYAEPTGFGGDGNDIVATKLDSGWRLDYSVGYGDCPAGCIARHVWSFAVRSDGGVEYLGSSGDPAPKRP